MRVFACCALSALASAAAGQQVFINDRTGFKAAAFDAGVAFQLESFETETPGLGVGLFTTGTTGTQFAPFSPFMTEIRDAALGAQPTDGDQTLGIAAGFQILVTIDLPRPATHVEMDIIDLVSTMPPEFDPEILEIRLSYESGATFFLLNDLLGDTPGTVQHLGVIGAQPITELRLRGQRSFGENDAYQIDRFRFGSPADAGQLGLIASPDHPLIADSFGSEAPNAVALWGPDGSLIATNNGSGPTGTGWLEAALSAGGPHWFGIAPPGAIFTDGLGATEIIGAAQPAAPARGTIAGRRLPLATVASFAPAIYRFAAAAGVDVLLPTGPSIDGETPIEIASGADLDLSSDVGVALTLFDASTGLAVGAGSGALLVSGLADGEYVLAAAATSAAPGGAPGFRVAPSDTTLVGAITPASGSPIPVSFEPGQIEYIPIRVGPGATVADVTTTGATLQGQPGFGEPDGVVDLDDLGYFLNFWLLGTP